MRSEEKTGVFSPSLLTPHSSLAFHQRHGPCPSPPNGFNVFDPAWVATQAADLAPLLSPPPRGVLQVSPFQAARGDQPPRTDFLLVGGIEGGVVRALSGPLYTGRGRWQINCWGRTPQEASLIARLHTGGPNDPRLDGFLGTLANVEIQACVLLDLRSPPSNKLRPRQRHPSNACIQARLLTSPGASAEPQKSDE